MAKNPKKVRQQLKKAAASVRRVSVRPKAEQGRKGKAKPAAKPAKRDTIQVDAVDQAKTHVDELRNDAVVSDAPATSRCPILPIPEVVETEEISVSVEVPAITAPPPAATQTRTAPMLPPSNPQEERRPGETLRSPGPSSTLLAPQRLPAEARKPKAPSFNWGSASVVVGSVAVAVFFAVELSRPTSGVMIDAALAQLEADGHPTAYLQETTKHTVETLYSPPPTEPMPAATIKEVEPAPVTVKDKAIEPTKKPVVKTKKEAIPSESLITDDEMEDAKRRAAYALRQQTTREEEWTMEALLLVGGEPTINTPAREAALRIAVGKLNGTGPFLSNQEALLAAARKIAAKSN